jgi:coatomer subunit beta'
MDPSGKLIYTRNHDVLSGNIQTISDDTSFAVGDGEYITYTALAWRNKSFGNGISFSWAPDSNTHAVLENKVKLRVYKNFREKGGAGMKGAGIDGLHGRTLLGARGAGFVMFWDWESGEIVRRINVEAKKVGITSAFLLCLC